MTAGRVDDEASECYEAWRDACAAADDAYCEWRGASADDWPGAFAAYRAALDHEESVAGGYGAVIDRLRHGSEDRTAGGERSADEEPPSATGPRARVLIADRDGFARGMLQRVLQDVGEVTMVTGARDGREAIELVRQCQPDVVLVDIGVPPAGGVELVRKLVAEEPRVRIVTLSAGAEWDVAVLAALRAGATGHIDKAAAPDQIAHLILAAAGGEAILPGRLMTRLQTDRHMPSPAADDRGAAA